jgi:hypothetical protein
MATKENQLNLITNLGTQDYARIVTSGGASTRARLSSVAETLLRTYAASFAGKTQSVGAALDNLATNEYNGQGYGTCETSASSTAKTVDMSGFRKTVGGVVTIKFSYNVPANATLNINDTGAYPIYYNNTNITAGIINAGDICTFMFDGSHYVLLNMGYMTTNSTQITLTASGVSAPSTLYKCGKVVMLSIQLGNGTALSSLTGVDTIGTLPEGYRPPAQRIFPISARNVGGWATATYYNAIISIDQTGVISLRGKASELKQAQYLMGTVTFLI